VPVRSREWSRGVRGLLYADYRVSLDDALPAIVTALQHERRRATMERGFWARADTLIGEGPLYGMWQIPFSHDQRRVVRLCHGRFFSSIGSSDRCC
jgi:hypothetical protein